MSGKIRIVQYINQFFAGAGGEEKSDHPITSHEGPAGPGLLIDKILGGEGAVVGTVFCGDGLFAEEEERCAAEAMERIKGFSPDLILAGPAFNAGRYGLACAAICRAAAEEAGIPAVTAMYPENPGVRAGGKRVYTVPCGDTAAGMEEALEGALRLGLKLARGEAIGNAAEEGYIPRGIRYNEISEVPTSQRAVDLVLNKIAGEPFETELEVPLLEKIPPPAPIADLGKAVIAIVSEGGMVPPGNPDRLAGSRNENWAKYSLAGKDTLPGGTFISIHGGFNTVFVNEDPDRMLAVDALRQLEREGEIAELHDDFLSTCGNGGAFETMGGIGRAWAKEIKASGVSGVVLPATWGTGTRSGAALARALEREGIPTVVVTCLPNVARDIGANRIVNTKAGHFHHPFGDPSREPEAERKWRLGAAREALRVLAEPVEGPTVFDY